MSKAYTPTGILVPLVTPFDHADRVDLDALEKLADEVLASGASGIVALATTGEPHALTRDERDAVVAPCARVCSDRGGALVVGAGTNDTASTITRHEALARVPRVVASLAVVPYYIRPSEAAIVRHFEVVAERSPVPLAAELADVARDVGFFLLRDPSIGRDVLDPVERAIREFFMLWLEEKMEINIARSSHHRGYFPIGEENALGSTVKDLKEGFDMALEVPRDDSGVTETSLYGPNVWPRRPADFQIHLQRIYDEMRRSASTIAWLFAVEWSLPRDYFVQRTDRPLTQLRAVRYPPQPSTRFDGDDPIGCGAHTDYSIVSIIWQVDEPGLQMRTRTGEWVDAPAVPGTFACTLGDATEIWTNGEWPATLHRVINTSGGERHSVAFFFDPNEDCSIAPLERFTGAGRPPRYVSTTMGAHVRRGFDGTCAYRADADQAEETAVG